MERINLPPSIKAAAGIKAFYFRDPDQHNLEIIYFPPDKGDPRWQEKTDKLFLGIEHTAIGISNSAASLKFYQDVLGLRKAGESENFGTEQEHLNQVFGAHVRITGMRADSGLGVEFLEYLTPTDGRPRPVDVRANDVVCWQTMMQVDDVDLIAKKCATQTFASFHRGLSQSPSITPDFQRAWSPAIPMDIACCSSKNEQNNFSAEEPKPKIFSDKTLMRLYETHLPVANTQIAKDFYTTVVGLPFAYRDPTRDIIFLWAGSKEEGMIGLWGPGTAYGPKNGIARKCHIALALSFDQLLTAIKKLNECGIKTFGFGGHQTDEPNVIGWMPSAQIYFRDPDGHTVEFINILPDAPDATFIGTYSSWEGLTKRSSNNQVRRASSAC